jgi:hypothetical protein
MGLSCNPQRRSNQIFLFRPSRFDGTLGQAARTVLAVDRNAHSQFARTRDADVLAGRRDSCGHHDSGGPFLSALTPLFHGV